MVDATAARHVVVDSTGIKIYGEGEWKVRQHGMGKGRSCLKLHLGVDEPPGEVIAAVAPYHRCALSETTIFRHKNAFGGKVRSRTFENQVVELLCQCTILNPLIGLGKPETVPVAA